MNNISWNEIRERAAQFVLTWSKAKGSERGEAQTFWADFFHVFGVSRRNVGVYEAQVVFDEKAKGFIDFLWKKNLVGEMKSRGKDLDKALSQAYNYASNLPKSDQPKFVLACNFDGFLLQKLGAKKEERRAFTLEEFPNNLDAFGFIAGYRTNVSRIENSVDVESAKLLCNLYDALKASKYKTHDTNIFMIRLLYCLFADDSGIWQKNLFRDYIKYRTASDGTDLDVKLHKLFIVLNTEPEKRYDKMDESLAAFPYVNGTLYAEELDIPSFDKVARTTLLECCHHDWSKVSPAIFGSIFQSIMNKDERRALGAHYTSEENILKVINPLFMDDLRAELDKIGGESTKLDAFHNKIASLKFLDPACGCGNFLVVAYRELRSLELEILKRHQGGMLNDKREVSEMVRVSIDQFYGIELEEWPARIANVSMWIQDHKSNVEVSQVFGRTRPSIPLKERAHIRKGNALRIEWPNADYIFGNPPFVGHSQRTKEQMSDMERVWGSKGRFGRLDFVSCWYKLAVSTKKPTAFVSTNSITQGEQVGILWPALKTNINFAYRTFPWTSEARGKAAVQCVIIGFGPDKAHKTLTDYESGTSVTKRVRKINGYLIEADEVYVESRTQPQSGFPVMTKGSQPTDGGHLILSEEEYEQITKKWPASKALIRPFLGADEFLHGSKRWCLWLVDAEPSLIKSIPEIMRRLQEVRKIRMHSPTESVRKLANQPGLFTQIRQPKTSYMIIPEVTSERRSYIPLGYVPGTVICSNKNMMIPNGSLYLFGLLSSSIHMAWIDAVCGRLGNGYSYSPAIYNSFPWPKATKEQQAAISRAAQKVLDVRESFKSNLASLYDPDSMPADLLKAHQALDAEVDRLYKPNGFKSEYARVAHLFKLYAKSKAPRVRTIMNVNSKRENSPVGTALAV